MGPPEYYYLILKGSENVRAKARRDLSRVIWPTRVTIAGECAPILFCESGLKQAIERNFQSVRAGLYICQEWSMVDTMSGSLSNSELLCFSSSGVRALSPCFSLKSARFLTSIDECTIFPYHVHETGLDEFFVLEFKQFTQKHFHVKQPDDLSTWRKKKSKIL